MNDFNKQQILYCKFCNKECYSLNSLKQHEIKCKQNPNRLNIEFSKKISRKGINKGKRWINNGIISKFVDSSLLENYLTNGWELGLDKSYKEKLSKILKGKQMGKCLDPEKEKARRHKISESMKGNTNWKFNKKRGNSKKGWYKGIFCDSTWELAFVVYYLDHNLLIKRCKKEFTYIYENIKHIYIPDFETDEGIIEIKGRKDKKALEKEKQFPEIKIIDKKLIIPYINYVTNKYGNNFWEVLYEK